MERRGHRVELVAVRAGRVRTLRFPRVNKVQLALLVVHEIGRVAVENAAVHDAIGTRGDLRRFDDVALPVEGVAFDGRERSECVVDGHKIDTLISVLRSQD